MDLEPDPTPTHPVTKGQSLVASAPFNNVDFLLDVKSHESKLASKPPAKRDPGEKNVHFENDDEWDDVKDDIGTKTTKISFGSRDQAFQLKEYVAFSSTRLAYLPFVFDTEHSQFPTSTTLSPWAQAYAALYKTFNSSSALSAMGPSIRPQTYLRTS